MILQLAVSMLVMPVMGVGSLAGLRLAGGGRSLLAEPLGGGGRMGGGLALPTGNLGLGEGEALGEGEGEVAWTVPEEG